VGRTPTSAARPLAGLLVSARLAGFWSIIYAAWPSALCIAILEVIWICRLRLDSTAFSESCETAEPGPLDNI